LADFAYTFGFINMMPQVRTPSFLVLHTYHDDEREIHNSAFNALPSSCRQIFINYKLKSVAHMPWRVLIYKAFNTFIDDVFAFWIMSDHMTKKHRYMTLRDDLVFLVFIYQVGAHVSILYNN
jgi:hypothetical protein